jgi:hypothetical protein
VQATAAEVEESEQAYGVGEFRSHYSVFGMSKINVAPVLRTDGRENAKVKFVA